MHLVCMWETQRLIFLFFYSLFLSLNNIRMDDSPTQRLWTWCYTWMCLCLCSSAGSICLTSDNFVNAERLFGCSLIPIKNTAGRWINSRRETEGVFVLSESSVHDSDMNDEVWVIAVVYSDISLKCALCIFLHLLNFIVLLTCEWIVT